MSTGRSGDSEMRLIVFCVAAFANLFLVFPMRMQSAQNGQTSYVRVTCESAKSIVIFGREGDVSSILGEVASGTVLIRLGKDGSWFKIRMQDGKEGYLSAACAESFEPQTSSPTPQPEQRVLSHTKTSEKYPLTLYVAGASSQVYTAFRMPGTPATPAETQCNGSVISTGGANAPGNTTGSVNMTCTTTPATPAQPGQEIKNVRVDLYATLNGMPISIGCNAGWVGSHCGELQPGSYPARWKHENHKQIRVLVLQAGKLREISLNVH
jgi:hypothetical protein